MVEKKLKGRFWAQRLLDIALTPDIMQAVEETGKQKKRTVLQLQQYEKVSLEVLIAICEQYEAELEQRNHYFMLAQRLDEVPKSLQWAILDTICAAYYNAAQMLRLILESTLQAFCLQQANPASYEEAVLKAKKYEGSFGKPMIRQCGLPPKLCKNFVALYGELSALSHASAESFQKHLKDSQLLPEFKYDEEEFERCARLLRQVMEAVFTIILKAFPKVREYDKLTGDTKSILARL